MAKKARKKIDALPAHRCSECVYAVERQGKALDGHFILCRCDYWKNGKFLHFLSDYQCEHFKPLNDGKETDT